MPIYEFDCKECGSSFDKLVRSAAAIGEVTCPGCDSPDIKKKLSLFSSRGNVKQFAPAASSASCAPGGL